MDFSFTLSGAPVCNMRVAMVNHCWWLASLRHDVQAEGIVCWDRHRIASLDVQSKERLRVVIDSFGRGSCKSQGLPAVITDLHRLQTSEHKLYLAISQASGRLTVYGGIKSGVKRLFIRIETGAFCEIEPACVLDFYVHEHFQRQGLGKQLFEHFLAAERQSAATVGYDRPSPKLLAFLRKHYGLANFIPQSNNFVVFSAYFQAVGQHSRPFSSPWTSVSQRPLTAKKGPNSRSTAGQGRASGAVPAQRLFDSQTGTQAAPAAVPAFRAAASKPPSRRQSPAWTSRLSSADAGLQAAEYAMHNDDAAGISGHDTLRPASDAGAQRQPLQLVSNYSAADHNRQVSSSSPRWQGGSGQASSSAVSQQSPEACQLQLAVHVARQAPASSQAVSSSRHALHPRAATGSSDTHSNGLGQDGSAVPSRGSSGHPTGPSLQYVKPPWAIDDPYQVAATPVPSMQQQQQSRQTDGWSTVPSSPWSYQSAAGRQQSGAGARNCLIW